eukprot:TRINITY_DN91645_c0_g1_i1.p1 TRINITY_DN91645_c0_g1~~TRINITY_DN91645_c0_g1_i1.p1  ORF type:complete len:387 (+),score=52.00 TRINITY_DN91645_c0_g1_i1:115-1161(+)
MGMLMGGRCFRRQMRCFDTSAAILLVSLFLWLGPLGRSCASCPPSWCLQLPSALFAGWAARHEGHSPNAFRGCCHQPRHLRHLAVRRLAHDPWSVLGINEGASKDEIKHAFKEKIRKAHPDAGGSAEQFSQVKDAYQEALQALNLGLAGGRQAGNTMHDKEHVGWSISDFYKWRRQEVQRERQNQDTENTWYGEQANEESDAKYREQHWYREVQERRKQQSKSERQSKWPGSPKSSATSSGTGHVPSSSSRKSSSSRYEPDRNKDLKATEWESFLKRGSAKVDGDASAATALRRKTNMPNQETSGDPVISHRTVATTKGDVRVPVFMDSGGARYYVSPLTSKKVRMPR